MPGNVPLASRRLGAGSPFFILHGLFGSGLNWRTTALGLEDRYQVSLVDLRNHGRSPHHASMGYAQMSADIHALMPPAAPIHLLGHSMGGKVAMLTALRNPERVERLIVVDIAPVSYQHDYTRLIAALQALDLGTLTGRTVADKSLRKDIPDDGLRQFLLQNLVHKATGYQWRINLPAIAENLSELTSFPGIDDYSPYPGPALFINGERSPYLLAEHHTKILSHFPHAVFHTIADAGHWLHVEQPTAFTTALENFLAASS